MDRTTRLIRTSRFALSANAVIVLLATSACVNSESRASAVTTDSAGVEIVESANSAWPEGVGWRLSDEPILDIGVNEGSYAYEFYRVIGARRPNSDLIVVADAGSFEIRFYDSAGTFLHSTGREGGGPGEFESIMSLEVLPENMLLVFDASNNRISYLDPSGNFLSSVTLRFLADMGGYPMIVSPFRDGTVLVGVRTYFGTGGFETGLSRDEIVYVRCDSGGQLIDTLAIRPGGEMHAMAQENRRLLGDRPFGLYPQYAVYEDGFFHGSGDRYEIEHFNSEGRLLRSLRRPLANMAVTNADIDAYKREQLENAEDDRQRRIREVLFETVSFPEYFPAYRNFIADADGNLWVSAYRRPGDETPRWIVFDDNGTMLGEVSTPERFTVYEIGSDYVLGRWADDLDVQHVLMFELVR